MTMLALGVQVKAKSFRAHEVCLKSWRRPCICIYIYIIYRDIDICTSRGR